MLLWFFSGDFVATLKEYKKFLYKIINLIKFGIKIALNTRNYLNLQIKDLYESDQNIASSIIYGT